MSPQIVTTVAAFLIAGGMVLIATLGDEDTTRVQVKVEPGVECDVDGTTVTCRPETSAP